MDKKTQKKRAFYAALAMLLVSAIVITTASFAWFTLGKNVAVDELDLKVTAKEGIVISANTDAWTNQLSYEDLDGTSTNAWKAYSGNTNNFPERIAPASSAFGTGSLPAFFEGGIDPNANGDLTMVAKASPAETHESGEKAGYYAFDIYIKYPGEKASITVDVGKSSVTVKDDPDTTRDQGDTNYYSQTEQAMRIGFANMGVVTAPTGGSVKESLVYNSKDADIASTKPVTGAGESAALEVTDNTVPTAKAGSLSIASAYSATKTADQAANAQLTLAGGINRVRVYIWMEGQDAMCDDNLASQYIAANLVFEMV